MDSSFGPGIGPLCDRRRGAAQQPLWISPQAPSGGSQAVHYQTNYYASTPAQLPLTTPAQLPAATATQPPEQPATPGETPSPAPAPASTGEQGPEATSGASFGPYDPSKGLFLQDAVFGDPKDTKYRIYGWYDGDYTYRSTGTGINNIAPVMNRFGDEYLNRSIGIAISKELDNKCWDWGFNAIFIGGADASFLGPTAGGWANTDPRFGSQFTDLNATFHLPILTDGGVDLKIGRQTTCLGPQGALPFQRYFDSSDYAWYNLEEGRYTGVSANWIISKQLSWYNGIEIGGWGVFFDDPSHGVNYLGQVNYWLDKEAKETKVWFTVLTGPTGFTNDGNTTAVEVGVQENWNKCVYQIVDFQMNYSKAPLFFTPPPGYQERAYDVYTILGRHLTTCLDVNTRFEWYDDVDGGGYPGGFGIPDTKYFETTLGLDWHPNKWLQFRPEIRYDHATNDAFGSLEDKKNQLSIAADVLIKF